jgi:hypothetical protein
MSLLKYFIFPSLSLDKLDPQLTAFFTSALILASTAEVNSVTAKAIGHIALHQDCPFVKAERDISHRSHGRCAPCSRPPRVRLPEEADDLAFSGICWHRVPELFRGLFQVCCGISLVLEDQVVNNESEENFFSVAALGKLSSSMELGDLTLSSSDKR